MNKIYKIIGKHGRITIPYELREKLKIRTNDIVSFELGNKDEVIVKKEVFGTNAFEENTPTKKPTDETTLLEFLDNLSPEEQHAAFVHLAVIRANKEEK